MVFDSTYVLLCVFDVDAAVTIQRFRLWSYCDKTFVCYKPYRYEHVWFVRCYECFFNFEMCFVANGFRYEVCSLCMYWLWKLFITKLWYVRLRFQRSSFILLSSYIFNNSEPNPDNVEHSSFLQSLVLIMRCPAATVWSPASIMWSPVDPLQTCKMHETEAWF